MENRNRYSGKNNFSFGFILLFIGSVLLLDRLDIISFSWVFSWPFIMIGFGVFLLIRHEGKNLFGVFLILFGTFFYLRRENWIPDEYYEFILPIGIIAVGLYLILNRRSKGSSDEFSDEEKKSFESSDPQIVNSDYIKAESVFAGLQRRLITKDFKGGKITTAFGGADIDLSKAEIKDKAVLDVEVIFGGLKLIIPPHWEVQADVSNVFSGIEDKRAFPSINESDKKTLYIKGSVSFGGLQFKSY